MLTARGARILMTTDTVGGVWSYSTTLASALAKRQWEVVLVTLGPTPRRDQLSALQGVRKVELEVTDGALEWMDPEGKDFGRTLKTLSTIARRSSPDIVHLNSYREAIGVWPTPVLLAAHSCVQTWWRACRREEPVEDRWATYAANVEAGLAASDIWVSPTTAFRDVLQIRYAPPRLGRVIHNGIDSECQIEKKEPFILAAGRLWDEAKNVTLLVSVADHLIWPVKLAGAGGPDRPREQRANVELLGEVPRADLLGLMARASIFAAPALYEPFGLGILEAATAGCALVLSDIPTLRELWDGAAIFVAPRDPQGFSTALNRICGSCALRTRLQHAARRRALSYSTAAMADAYCRAYGELLGRSARPFPATLESMRGYA